MLKQTFCHLPGVGLTREQQLWSSGVTSWEELLRDDAHANKPDIVREIEGSLANLEKQNPLYFAERLDAQEHWRLFREFRDSVAYLDIETTGLRSYADHITTIAVYDGASIFHYVHGQNISEFKRDIRKYKLLITYNGKCFDIPFLERYFDITIPHAQIDLRYVLKRLGYSGGLKRCEQQVGIHRDGLEDVDGFMAVLFWNDYMRSKNERTLETLLAYNIEDVINLEHLMIHSYNLHVRSTPFARTLALPMPDKPENPFTPDAAIINRLRGRMGSRPDWRGGMRW